MVVVGFTHKKVKFQIYSLIRQRWSLALFWDLAWKRSCLSLAKQRSHTRTFSVYPRMYSLPRLHCLHTSLASSNSPTYSPQLRQWCRQLKSVNFP